MWCVTCVPGFQRRFRYATRRADGLVVTSLPAWRRIDPAAADQFVEPDDTARALQHEFMVATGLASRGVLSASMNQAGAKFAGDLRADHV